MSLYKCVECHSDRVYRDAWQGINDHTDVLGFDETKCLECERENPDLYECTCDDVDVCDECMGGADAAAYPTPHVGDRIYVLTVPGLPDKGGQYATITNTEMYSGETITVDLEDGTQHILLAPADWEPAEKDDCCEHDEYEPLCECCTGECPRCVEGGE